MNQDFRVVSTRCSHLLLLLAGVPLIEYDLEELLVEDDGRDPQVRGRLHDGPVVIHEFLLRHDYLEDLEEVILQVTEVEVLK